MFNFCWHFSCFLNAEFIYKDNNYAVAPTGSVIHTVIAYQMYFR